MVMMRLRYSKPSPYARKVRMVAHELGLSASIELINTETWNLPSELLAENPLGKIPSLLLPDGTVLYDSAVIAEYLTNLVREPALLPAPAHQRFRVLRLQALGDGIMDAAVERFCEVNFREPAQRSQSFIDRFQSVAIRAVDYLETVAPTELREINIGTVAILAALGYLDHRFPDDQWRQGRPALSGWFQTMSARPSFAATAP